MIRRDARGDAQRGHGGEPRECDERAAAVVRGTDEADEVRIPKKRGVSSPLAREHHQTKSAGAEQFVHGAKRVHPALRAHEERTLLPERAGNRSGDIDPRRAVTVCDSRSNGGTHDGCRTTARLPDGQPAEGKATAGECAVELGDPRDDWIGGVPRNLDSVGETLFKQGSECGGLGRHGMEMIPNKHRINKVATTVGVGQIDPLQQPNCELTVLGCRSSVVRPHHGTRRWTGARAEYRPPMTDYRKLVVNPPRARLSPWLPI